MHMEGLAWLLLKMGALLALTGAAFFALGWWLRGRQAAPSSGIQSGPDQSVPVSRPELAEKIESLRGNLRTAEAERDAARKELSAVREELSSAADQIRGLKGKAAAAPTGESSATPPPQDAPAPAPAKPAKPKTPRKPRAKKAKG